MLYVIKPRPGTGYCGLSYGVYSCIQLKPFSLQMHPRNRYKHSKPDFSELGEFYPSLKPYLIHRGCGSQEKSPATHLHACTLDFSNPEALRELTCAILARDFGIKLEIPLNMLIPAVPQRLNYIHWVEDLLCEEEGNVPRGEAVTGIDIGE